MLLFRSGRNRAGGGRGGMGGFTRCRSKGSVGLNSLGLRRMMPVFMAFQFFQLSGSFTGVWRFPSSVRLNRSYNMI